LSIYKVPTCKRVSAGGFDTEFANNQSDVIDTMMSNITSSITQTAYWDQIFAQYVNSPFISSIQTVSVSFTGNDPDWYISDRGGLVYSLQNTQRTAPSSSLVNDTFYATEDTQAITNANPYYAVIDVTIWDGRTYRISGTPVGYFVFNNEIDVNGTFDFRDSQFGGSSIYAANSKEILGSSYYPSVSYYTGLTMNGYLLSEVTNVSAVRQYANGTQAAITDQVILNLLNNPYTQTSFTSFIDVLSAADNNTIMENIIDGFGIIHGRKILERAAPYSNKDNLKTMWIEDDGGYYGPNAYVCDYGQMKLGLPPYLMLPHVPFVEKGIDYNF